jgi:hypothetical protein
VGKVQAATIAGEVGWSGRKQMMNKEPQNIE